jgi:hypothetical protein
VKFIPAHLNIKLCMSYASLFVYTKCNYQIITKTLLVNSLKLFVGKSSVLVMLLVAATKILRKRERMSSSEHQQEVGEGGGGATMHGTSRPCLRGTVERATHECCRVGRVRGI